jgi:rhodanese-related sulfurtransferase
MAPESRGKSPILFFIISLFIYILSGCAGREPFDIDVEEAVAMIADDSSLTVIDVRTSEEYTGELGHIPESRLIPIGDFKDSIEALSYLRDSTIIAVCKVGYRSKKAVLLLKDSGFRNVYNLYGGMIAWNREGGEIDR